ncbi:MAG: S9 family peptidase [Oscillospiraceae bacterium]|nr:S9 family peptidase [Oscillospiraceae bacterium]
MHLLECLKKLPSMLDMQKEEAPAAFADSVQLYKICYECDGCRVMGYIALPLELPEQLPCCIYNRGGNRDFAYLRPAMICQFAKRGLAVFASQYRGNVGGTGMEEFGGAEVNDVIRLIDMALAFPWSCSKKSVYMIGHSRGGMMTYLACARDPRIKAAVVAAGISDSFIMYQSREWDMKEVYHELVGGGPKEKREEFIARSATYWPEKIIPPMLILQGTADWRVTPNQGRKMYRKLKEVGKECKLIIYPGADHSLRGTAYQDAAVQWLLEHPLEEAKQEKSL